MIVYACNPSILEVEAGSGVGGQPGLHRLVQKTERIRMWLGGRTLPNKPGALGLIPITEGKKSAFIRGKHDHPWACLHLCNGSPFFVGRWAVDRVLVAQYNLKLSVLLQPLECCDYRHA
jgi:hypothetical protein